MCVCIIYNLTVNGACINGCIYVNDPEQEEENGRAEEGGRVGVTGSMLRCFIFRCSYPLHSLNYLVNVYIILYMEIKLEDE